MTDLDAAAQRIVELGEKATPGPWEYRPGNPGRGNIISVCKGMPQKWVAQATGQETFGEREDNAGFIAFARNYAPAIAAEYLRLRDVEKAARELFLTSQNEMVSRGLPLEWQDDCAMGRMQRALAALDQHREEGK